MNLNSPWHFYKGCASLEPISALTYNVGALIRGFEREYSKHTKRKSQMLTAELVLDAEVLLGEGPWWNARTGQLYWVDIEGCAVHVFDPASGNDRKIEVGQMVGCVVGR